MKNKIINVSAVLLMLLGLIHDIATFTPLISGGVDEGKINALMYMSLMCGTSLILCSVLILLLLSRMKDDKTLIAPIRLIGLFLAFAGVLAIYFMPYNPFAWATFVICSIICLCLISK